MQVSCSCDVHHRCALGFVEDAIPRAGANGARTIMHQVTCPNSALHAVHQEVDLRPLRQQIRGLGRSANTTERTIGASVTAAEIHLNRRSTTSTETIELLRSAAERGEEGMWGDWRGRAPQQRRVETPCAACGRPVLGCHRFAFAG